MAEYLEYVQKGMRIILPVLENYVAHKYIYTYGDEWWNEARYVCNDVYNLPEDGTNEYLIGCMDIAMCCKMIDRRWKEIFGSELDWNCRTYIKELQSVRNVVSHNGSKDVDQRYALRAVDTMWRLCSEIAPAKADELKALYEEVHGLGNDNSLKQEWPVQPKAASSRGELKEGSLLKLVGTDVVQKTTLTRKVTFAGKTEIYPVYKVRLDRLYYNDQNDRISTWIAQYESENGEESLQGLDRDFYNRVIENFVVESNEESIHKTQRNIELVGQREPGVTLADGRIVDGNRRFTCLRRIQREKDTPVYFETVIMDADMQEDKKQIKLLELAIQHGEEKKVDYDLIDYALGTYRDIVQTKLLTEREYAESTNEPLAEVKKRIEIAEVINEFLSYINLPGKFHVAREYQVYSLFQEMMPLLKKLNEEEQGKLKKLAFTNAISGAIPDQRKFIRDIKKIIASGSYTQLFNDVDAAGDSVKAQIETGEIHTKEDVDNIAKDVKKETRDIQASVERSLQRMRAQQLKSRPNENVNKCIDLLMEIDSKMFAKLDEDDRENLKAGFKDIERIAATFKGML